MPSVKFFAGIWRHGDKEERLNNDFQAVDSPMDELAYNPSIHWAIFLS